MFFLNVAAALWLGAQSGTSAITELIKDATGAAIGNARAALLNGEHARPRRDADIAQLALRLSL